MNCEKIQKQLLLFHADALNKYKQRRMQTHLGQCSACQEFYGFLESVNKDYVSNVPETPTQTRWALLAAARNKSKVKQEEFFTVLTPVFSVAVVLLILGVSYYMFTISKPNFIQNNNLNPSIDLAWEDDFDSDVSKLSELIVIASESMPNSIAIEDVDSLATELLELGDS